MAKLQREIEKGVAKLEKAGDSISPEVKAAKLASGRIMFAVCVFTAITLFRSPHMQKPTAQGNQTRTNLKKVIQTINESPIACSFERQVTPAILAEVRSALKLPLPVPGPEDEPAPASREPAPGVKDETAPVSPDVKRLGAPASSHDTAIDRTIASLDGAASGLDSPFCDLEPAAQSTAEPANIGNYGGSLRDLPPKRDVSAD